MVKDNVIGLLLRELNSLLRLGLALGVRTRRGSGWVGLQRWRCCSLRSIGLRLRPYFLDEIWHDFSDFKDVIADEQGNQEHQIVWHHLFGVEREINLRVVECIQLMLYLEAQKSANDVFS